MRDDELCWTKRRVEEGEERFDARKLIIMVAPNEDVDRPRTPRQSC